MEKDLDVSGILNSPQLQQDIQILCHNPVYYRLRRWIESERSSPIRAKRLASGIGWAISQKLFEGITDVEKTS